MLLNIVEIIAHVRLFILLLFWSIYCFLKKHMVLFINGTILLHNVFIYLLFLMIPPSYIFT